MLRMVADVVALKANRKVFNIVRVYSAAALNVGSWKTGCRREIKHRSVFECVYLYFKFKKTSAMTSRIELLKCKNF